MQRDTVDNLDKELVLVVSDDTACRIMCCIMLIRMGYAPIRCKEALSALNLLGQDTFELLITDLDMPSIDGIGLIQRVRDSLFIQNIPILLMLEEKDKGMIKMALDEGASDFIYKNFVYKTFFVKVRRMMEKPIAY